MEPAEGRERDIRVTLAVRERFPDCRILVVSVVSQLVRFCSHVICPHQLILPEDPLLLAEGGFLVFG